MAWNRQAGIILPGYDPLRVANAPTIGTASLGDTQVTVAFTAPSCVGGGAITSYTAYANCGVKTASGASSPLTVTGLTNGTTYTFKVIATNAYGPSFPSAASNSVIPGVQGQQAYTTAGTYSWVAPAGVTAVAVVAVGGGGGYLSNQYNNCGDPGFYGYTGGGGLGYKNNYSVTPGSSYTVVVGDRGNTASCQGPQSRANGGNSYFVSTAIAYGQGGQGNKYGGSYAGTGGGVGGGSGLGASGDGGGGSGAAGYSGNGGDGSSWGFASPFKAATSGAGGGGSGGWGYGGGTGGGVGILGQGASGTAPTQPASSCTNSNGNPGSGGTGATYGGAGSAGGGAVRIIWPASSRSFPSTNTGDL